MASKTLAHGVAQLSIPSLPSVEKSFANNKRHAIYIPQSFFEKARRAVAEADEASTWEFSATISPSTPATSESPSSAASSPAQEIVIRYRSGMPLQLDACETQSDLSIDDEDDEGNGSLAFHTPVTGSESLRPLPSPLQATETEDTEIKLLCRQSLHPEGLSKACEEALQVIEKHGLQEGNSVACQRSGCSDTLRSVKDLTFHLHIHDIHDGLVSCPRCHHFYEDQRELDVHDCTGRRVRSFVSPFRSILARLLSKLAYHK